MSPVCGILTESALRPIQSISRDVRLFVCGSVCPSHPMRDFCNGGGGLVVCGGGLVVGGGSICGVLGVC